MEAIKTSIEYQEEVLKTLQNSRPGWRYNISKLKEPARFIAAVKELMDKDLVTGIEFNHDYTIIKKQLIF